MKRNSIWIPIDVRIFIQIQVFQGLKLHFIDEEINELLRKECISFCRWLRKKYFFPIKCNIKFEYCSMYKNESSDRSGANAVYYPPKISESNTFKTYPEINIAVASFEVELKKYGVSNAILFYCDLIAHESTHYYQWYFYETDSGVSEA